MFCLTYFSEIQDLYGTFVLTYFNLQTVHFLNIYILLQYLHVFFVLQC